VGLLFGTLVQRDLDAFRDGLREYGWIDGENVIVDVRSGEGDVTAYEAHAVALVNLPSDLIVTSNSTAALALKRATTTIPIVMAGVQEPLALGLVSSLGQPGGNVTGLGRLTTQLGAKRLEILKEVLTDLSRVVMLWDSSQAAALGVAQIESVAPALGLKVQVLEVKSADDFEPALAAAIRERAEAMITNGALFRVQRERLAQAASRARIPSIHSDKSYVEAGLLMSFGEDLPAIYRRSAAFVDRIFRGAKPADLPIEEPRVFEFAVNLTTAEMLGLHIPQSLGSRVTEWIR